MSFQVSTATTASASASGAAPPGTAGSAAAAAPRPALGGVTADLEVLHAGRLGRPGGGLS